MRKWVYKTVSVLLSALVIGASADVAFALPKKLPKLKGGKRPRITVPKTPSTRNLPPTSVARPNVTTQVERAVTQKAAQTPRKMPSKRAPKKTPQQIIDAFKKWVAKHPGTSPRMTIRENRKLLSLTELRKRVEQGDEQAANIVDELELGLAINAARHIWSKDSPEYQELDALYNQNRNRAEKKMPQQIVDAYKQWLVKHPGTSPRKGIAENGNFLSVIELRKRAEQGDEQAAKLAYELELGTAIDNALNNWPKNLPEYQKLDALYNQNRNRAEKKTPQQIIEAYKQWLIDHPGTSPRGGINGNEKRIMLTELRERAMQGDAQAAILADELELGKAIAHARQNWSKDSPEYQELDALYNQNRNTKTRQQVLATFTQWVSEHPGTSPRMSIQENGKLLTLTELHKRAEQGDAQAAELADELELGKTIAQALQDWPQDGNEYKTLKALYDENRNRVATKPTVDLYQDLVAHIKNFGHYPMHKESSLYMNIYNRLRYYRSTMIDGKYADPWLQKIYELKTIIQNAPDGKFTFTPDGQGGYTVEIEEPVTEELDVSAPQQVEEVAPAVPSRHALHKHITEDIKNMILQVRDQAALARRDFYPWLKDMQQNHLDQIVNKDTSDALWALNRAISFDHKTGQNRRAVTYLLQTVNNYVGILGIDEELGYFNKIIYRGKLEPGMLPQADLFHVVAEQEGMSFDGTLAPQVEELNKLAWQAYKQGQPLSVNFADDDNQDMLTALEIEKGVPIQTVKQDFQTAIQTLLPPGFEVRMGLHELGISGRDMTKFRKGHLHIHLERPATTEEMQDGFLTDVSISFDIKGLGRFVRKYNKYTRRVEPLTDKEIAQNYLTLFGSFLDQAAKDKLSDLAR